MKTQELIEHALLDAVGLLDEQERDAFDHAFRAAPPAVQAQVRREQTRFAGLEGLLPDVMPPEHLRAAVLEAVRRAMAEEEAADAPIAFVPPMARTAPVSRWWRAGALGLATAAAVFAAATVYLWNANTELRKNFEGDLVIEKMASQLGHAYVRDVLLNPDVKRVVFSPAADTGAEASIFFSPEWENSMFVCANLAPTDGRPYRLAVVDENDRVVEELATIDATGLVTPRKVKLGNAASRLAVFAPGENGRTGPIISRADLGL